jgi:hypothetical protein
MQTLRGEDESIVIDSSPVLAVRGPLLLARAVDDSCLILRARHSSAKASIPAVCLLADAETPASGIVPNSVRHGKSAYCAYAYRTYGNYGPRGV